MSQIRYFFIFTAFILISFTGNAYSKDAKPYVSMVMDGPIGPAYYEYLKKGIELAEEKNAQLLLIKLNTAGGLLTSTRDMVSLIMESPVPVALYVSPAGAHAASAGTFIVMSAHIAAMKNGTNIGAATPVQVGDSPIPSNIKEQKAPKDDLHEKAIKDSSAFIRGIAKERGRNAEWGEMAVINAESLTAKEALENNVIDFIAKNDDELLSKIDGKVIKLKDGDIVTLDLSSAKEIKFEPDFITQFLTIITNPNLAVILMMLGVYGLLLEFYNPGTMVAGVIGAISLTIGLYAINILPIDAMGLVLLTLGLIFMTAESFVPSFGILGIGGVIAFITGASIMFDSQAMPGLEVTYDVLIGIGVFGVFLVLLTVYLTYKVYNREATTGAESIVGGKAEIIDWKGKEGRVRIQGVVWQAYSDDELELSPKDKVVVAKIEDLKLKVII